MEDIYYLMYYSFDEINFNCINKSHSYPNSIKFPGVYMSLITKDNIYQDIYPDAKYYLLFSVRLLEQINYHINISNANGAITEFNTYFPFNLKEAVKIIKNKNLNNMNEVIFHDKIDMKYCCKIIERHLNDDIKQMLPREQLSNNENPDKTLIPFYCFNNEDLYDSKKSSTPKWLIMLAKVAMIYIDTNITLTSNEIILLIRQKTDFIYNNRSYQNLELFKAYYSNLDLN
jgi:hypothetical protein